MKFILSSILLLSVSIGWIQALDVSEQVDELNESLREATASLEAMLDRVEEQGWDKLIRKALTSTQVDRYLDSEVVEIERTLFGEGDVQEDMTTEQEDNEVAKIENLLRQDVTTQGWSRSISRVVRRVASTVKNVVKNICDVTALEQEVKTVDQLLDAREQLASMQETEVGVDKVNLGEDELADIMSFLDQAKEQDWVELQKAERDDENSALGRLEALMDLANQRARVKLAQLAQGGREVTKEEALAAENLIYRHMAKKLLKMLQDKA